MHSHPRIDAALAVDHSLRTAETASKSGAMAAADLLATLLRQHAVMNAPDAVGLSAIKHASRAVALAVEAREEHIRAHGALNVDLKKLGLDELFSKGSGPPQEEFDWRTFGRQSDETVPTA